MKGSQERKIITSKFNRTSYTNQKAIKNKLKTKEKQEKRTQREINQKFQNKSSFNMTTIQQNKLMEENKETKRHRRKRWKTTLSTKIEANIIKYKNKPIILYMYIIKIYLKKALANLANIDYHILPK